MRVKTMRRGLQDFEYLRLIEKSGKKSREQLIQLGDEILLGRQPDYPKLRRMLFNLLAGR